MKLGYWLAVILLAEAPAVAQKWSPPKTPDGQPDLQGVWTNGTATPLERPAALAGKEFFTEQEAAAYEKELRARTDADRRDGPVEADVGRAYNDFWWDRGKKVVGSRRTSLIVDPEDGRIPPLTPEGKNRAGARAEARRRHPADGPEDRPLGDRCIVWQNEGPPMIPSVYNNNYRIVQTPGYVVIQIEMIHDARVIPLDGRPHLPQNVRQWLGDSRGHWEGNTLVVDTTNFTDKTNFRGSGAGLHVEERFSRVDPETILYEFKVEDPANWTSSWSAQIPMSRTSDLIFEYACHEGNYAMAGILGAARAEENAAAAKGSR